MKYLIFIPLIYIAGIAKAQELNKIILQGNEAYQKADYKTATGAYEKALQMEPNNIPGKYNLANALYKQNQFENAAANYLSIIQNTTDHSTLSKTWYNLGNSFIKQKKIQDAINAYRQSLLLDPADNDTRENLQKAINEKQQQNKNNQSNKKPDSKKSKNQINQALAEQYMQQLRDQEKQMQKQLEQKPPTGQKGKDW
ncbi:MAG: CDC27 family protein [Chitinophagaceae bacterium]